MEQLPQLKQDLAGRINSILSEYYEYIVNNRSNPEQIDLFSADNKLDAIVKILEQKGINTSNLQIEVKPYTPRYTGHPLFTPTFPGITIKIILDGKVVYNKVLENFDQ